MSTNETRGPESSGSLRVCGPRVTIARVRERVRARAAGATLFAAATCLLSAYAGAAANPPAKSEDGKPYLGGVWLVEKPQREAKTTAGKAPPLRPAAAALYEKRKQAKASGKPTDDPLDQCLPHGVPRLLNAAQPIQILQKPKQVTILYEANHQPRLFYLNEPVPTGDDAPDPTYLGTSVGRWVGNVLVVETVGMNDKTWLDDVGLPHSEALTVEERYELVGNDRLRVTVKITDPETFTAPWDMQVTLKKQSGVRLKEDPCAEKLWTPPSTK
jgi:hypothetical protein